MHFKLATRLCFLFAFVCSATGQRIGSWASPQTSIWNSGSSFSSNVPSNVGSWGSNNAPSTAWSANTYTGGSGSSNSGNGGNSKWDYDLGNNFDSSSWSSNKPTTNDTPRKQNSNNGNWKSDAFSSNKKQGEKKLASITNWSPESSKFGSKGNSNGEKNFKETSGQNNRPSSNSGNWNSNSLNTNEVFSSSEDEDNNIGSWSDVQNSRPSFSNEKNSGNRKPYDNKRPENNYSSNNNNNFNNNINNNYNNNNNNNFNNNYNNNNNNNKKTTNDKKPSKGTTNWNSNSRPDEQNQSGSEDTKKTSSVDLSILDELDKNDWYFGKESDYPRPPFKTNLNIDVSELWNVQPQKQSQSQSFRETNNNNNNRNNNNKRRRNRETRNFKDGFGELECECVSVTECNEDDMMLSQKNIADYGRPLEDYICQDLTEVCCINPYPKPQTRANVKKAPLECGQRKIGDDFDSFGDDVARPGEFPWSLQLDFRRGFNCSASLIHPQLALTAGHCVQNVEPKDLKLTAGMWNKGDESSQARRVARTILHPEYDDQKPRNDIALLILENPFELTDNVNTICLPVTNDIWDPNRCFVAGWKPEEINGETFQVLGKTKVGFLPQYDCQNMLLVTDMWRNYILHDSFACGIDKTGQGSCLSGEGGAVVCPSGKSFVQVGIISDGVNCDKYGRPGIFTDVLQFLDWINENAFDLGFFDDIGARSLQ